MGAQTLHGEDIYNTKDEDLGDLKEIMIDMRSGRIAYAVVSHGGLLGMGQKLFAIPWSALKLDTVKKRFTLDITKERMEAAPGFDKSAWSLMADETWATQIHSYYKAKPYWE
jgi:sporulation protein YlmC with PRC-barrel domain